MKGGAAIGGAIQGGLSILGTHMQNKSNQRMAKDQRDWNERQANTQWQRDLDMWHAQNRYNEQMMDNTRKYNEGQIQGQRDWDLAMWERQNKYNSPIEQMARLKEAGLNPHLMYGQGTLGQAGGLTTQSNKGQQPSSNRPTAPSVAGYSRTQAMNVLNGIRAFEDIARLKNIQAQTNNVEHQSDLLTQDKFLKSQEMALRALNLRKSKVSTRQAEALEQNVIEAADTNLAIQKKKLESDTLEYRFQSKTFDKRYQRYNAELQNIYKRNTGQSLENELKRFEAKLNKKGLTKSDNYILRMGVQAYEQGDISSSDLKILTSIFFRQPLPKLDAPK